MLELTRFRRISTLLLLLGVFVSPSAGGAQDITPDSGWSAALGLITIPGHQIYSGRVALRSGGFTSGGLYKEETDLAVGVQAQAFLTTETLGGMSLSVYGTRAQSTGFYSGLGREDTLQRDLLTIGFDMGWEPELASGETTTLRVPFGPSLVWQSLDLSGGHRDEYADPNGLGTPPDVDWSDRRWLSLGGYGGLGLTVTVSEHVGITLDGKGRFFFSDKGSWAGQEEEDILGSTGNTVHLTYEEPVIFLWTARVGLLWRP